jgi:hypothetical protein
MTEETRTAIVQIRIRPSLKASAEKAAAADHRSLTGLIEKLLTDYCNKHGPSEIAKAKRGSTK